MATLTFGEDDPLNEARALINLLTQLIEDHPQQPPRAAKAHFEYNGDDGFPFVIVITLDEV